MTIEPHPRTMKRNDDKSYLVIHFSLSQTMAIPEAKMIPAIELTDKRVKSA